MLLTEGTIAAFTLVLTRTAGVISTAPLFGLANGFSGYKIALIFFLALILYGAQGEPLVESVPGAGLAAMMLREFMIGLFLAFMLHLVVLAVHVAGELISSEMGFLVARQVDPATGVSTPLITSIYEKIFILALFALNGHHLLIRALGHSFERAPIGSMSLEGGVAETVQGMFGEMFGAGIVFAAPVLVFLMVVSILMGLLARAVPHLNVLEIGFTIRVGVALVVMFLFAPLLEPALTGLHQAFADWMGHGLDALEG